MKSRVAASDRLYNYSGLKGHFQRKQGRVVMGDGLVNRKFARQMSPGSSCEGNVFFDFKGNGIARAYIRDLFPSSFTLIKQITSGC